jgi:hypothetical protein
MCDAAEAVADFLQWCTAGEEEDGEGQLALIDSNGNPWPIDRQGFARWEQAIRSLKQMVMHNG